jgi:predicted dehydrogenase
MAQPRIALVGVSGFAAVHFAEIVNLSGQGRVRPVAAAIINQDEEPGACTWLRESGCRLYDNFEAMLCAEAQRSDRPDAVLIPTGLHLHAQMTEQALLAGFDVVVEKPAAADMHGVERMLAAERTSGKRATVAYQHRCVATTAVVEQMLAERRIGEVTGMSLLGLKVRPLTYHSRNQWAGRRRVADQVINDTPFHNAFAHFVDLCCHFAGFIDADHAQPERVDGSLWRARDIESCDTASLTVAFASGLCCHVHCSHSCASSEPPAILIRGSSGTIEWHCRGAATLTDDRGRRVELARAGNDRIDLWNNILRWVEGDPASRCASLASAAGEVRISDLARNLPIGTIPDDRITMQQTDDGPAPVISGIDAVLSTAWRACRGLTDEERTGVAKIAAPTG